MATTSIHSINTTVDKAINYIIDKNKADRDTLVKSVGCAADGATAAKQFEQTRINANSKTTVIAKHLIQSFLPGEVTAEEAHKIGLELCEKLLGNSYQYVIATHIDKQHIHNHIIFNEVNSESGKSFETLMNRGGKIVEHIQKISDQLCLEHELSVIKNPKLGKGKSHYEWDMNRKGQSWKTQLKNIIDRTISESDNFDDFLSKLRAKDVEVVYRPENTIKIKFRLPEQQKFARGKTLGWYYDEPQIKRRIQQSYLIRTGRTSRKQKTKIIDTSTERMQNSKGLQRWADIQNMKEASKILNLLTAKGIDDQSELENRAISTYGDRVQIVGQLNDLQSRIDDLSDSIRMINQYYKYKPVKDEYRKSRAKKKFASAHEKELNFYNNAVAEMSARFPDHKVPTVEKLRDEQTRLISQRKELNEQYKKIAAELKELDYIRQTIQDYLDKSTTKEKRQVIN